MIKKGQKRRHCLKIKHKKNSLIVLCTRVKKTCHGQQKRVMKCQFLLTKIKTNIIQVIVHRQLMFILVTQDRQGKVRKSIQTYKYHHNLSSGTYTSSIQFELWSDKCVMYPAFLYLLQHFVILKKIRVLLQYICKDLLCIQMQHQHDTRD